MLRFLDKLLTRAVTQAKSECVMIQQPFRLWVFFWNWIPSSLAVCAQSGSNVMCGFCGFCGHLVGWWNTSTHRWNLFSLPARQFYVFSIVESLPVWKTNLWSLKSNLKKKNTHKGSSTIKRNCRQKTKLNWKQNVAILHLFYLFLWNGRPN